MYLDFYILKSQHLDSSISLKVFFVVPLISKYGSLTILGTLTKFFDVIYRETLVPHRTEGNLSSHTCTDALAVQDFTPPLMNSWLEGFHVTLDKGNP